MRILSFTTSSDVLSVAVSQGEDLVAEITCCIAKKHSVTLLSCIDTVLSLSETDISQIGLFVCDTGPGSFTGIRIGVSTANAMAVSTGKPVVGISSLDLLAGGADRKNVFISSVIYARNDQVYAALYKNKELYWGYFAGSIDEYLHILEEKTEGNIFFVGDGSSAFRDRIRDRFADRANFFDKEQNIPRAFLLSGIALKKEYIGGYAAPFYLKKSSAKENVSGNKV